MHVRHPLSAGIVLVLLLASSARGQQSQPAPPSPPRLQLRGEVRERIEGVENAGFVASRDDLYYLSRFRVNATVAASRQLAFQVQAQDARVGRKTIGPTGAPFKAPFDLRQAFADVGGAKAPLSARLGRQELAFGEMRLVGHLNWVNAARTFDAARIIWRAPAFQIDAFAASVVRILDGFDRSGNGNRFVGAYMSAPKALPLGSVEPYVFWRRDVNQRPESGTLGTLAQATFGARVVGRLPARFDYGIEVAAQRGSLAGDSIGAWAGHWQLRRTFAGAKTVRLAGEYNYATGDSNPTDGRRNTFDQLYPTGHDKLGLADQVGWRNVHHVRAIFDITPLKGLPVSASYHSFWLAEGNDGLYGANGVQIARVAAGAASTHVGQELDVQVTRAITPQLQLAAGYAHMFTGAFLKEATPGASFSHPYVMATYAFLAER